MFCPHCGARLAAAEEAGEVETRCPHCSAWVQVPRSMFGARPPEEGGAPPGPAAEAGAAEESDLPELLDDVQSTTGVKDPKALARVVLQVWEKMHVKPPGAAATAVLLLVYVGSLALLVLAPVVLLVLAEMRARAGG